MGNSTLSSRSAGATIPANTSLIVFRTKRDRVNPKTLFMIIVMLTAARPASVVTGAQDSQRTVWDGVYNNQQAKRGEAAFVEACSNCHGRTLEGADMTPALTGGAFMANWN